jgi:hypothetical protein
VARIKNIELSAMCNSAISTSVTGTVDLKPHGLAFDWRICELVGSTSMANQ